MKSLKIFGGTKVFNKASRGVTSISSLTAPNSKLMFLISNSEYNTKSYKIIFLVEIGKLSFFPIFFKFYNDQLLFLLMYPFFYSVIITEIMFYYFNCIFS